MKFRTISISVSAMLLATLLVPVAVSSPVQAQSQTSWYVNDNPTLFGPQQFWFHGASGHGYGTNNYRYTYAIGGDPSPNNWARWNMGSRVGQQEIQVYVPTNDATATVNYNVTIGGDTSKVRVAQNGTRGWYSLGRWNTNGANVVIAVYDNDAEQHHERNGLASSSIGVDAIAMRCVSSNCGSTPPPPPPPPDPPPPPPEPTETDATVPRAPQNLRLQVVAESNGSRTVVATWSPPSSDGGSAITRYQVTFSRPGRTFNTGYRSASNRRSTITGALANTTYTVRVRAENRIGLSSTVSASIRTTSGPSPERPEPPRNLRLQVVSESDGSRTVVATWSPPSSDGGSAITGYKVTFSRPGRTFNLADRSASNRRATIRRALANTTYTVRVRAENRIGLSSTVSASVWTGITQTAERPQPPRNVRLEVVSESNGSRTVVATWSPPSSDGGSAITGYQVTFSRPGRTFNTVDRSASNRRSTITNALANTTYTVRVRAENRIGLSSTVRASVDTPTPPGGTLSKVEDLDYESGGYRTVGRFRFQVIDLEWNRVSGASSYEMEWDYPGITRSMADAEAQCRGDVCSAEFLRNPNNPTLDIRVRAKTGTRTGEWSRWISIRRVPCPTSGKYTTVNDWGPHNALKALQSFWWDPPEGSVLVTEPFLIEEGDEGGQVNHDDDRSLSQKECSWVVKGSIVEDDGKVYGNALITNDASVEGKASVYGNAIVSGARIAGGAHVYGNAEISGGAVIKGTADISGNVKIKGGEISSGTFDGITEYIDAFVKIHREVYGEIFETLQDCRGTSQSTNDSINQRVKRFIGLAIPPPQSGDDAILLHCVQESALGEVIRAALPGWTDLLPYGAGALATLIKLSNVADDLEDNEYEQLRDVAAHIRTLYNDIEKIDLCDEACEDSLESTVNDTWR